MIKDIHIKNFRCFDDLKVSGFERINLISGKNNVGKTALLEALFLNSVPRPDTIFLLRQVRRESPKLSRALPERTWNNFFFQQNKNSELIIDAIFEDGSSKIVEICVDESIKDLEVEDSEQLNNNDQEKMLSLFSGSQSVVSVMHIKTRSNHQKSFETSIASSAKGLLATDIKIPDIKDAFFMPSFLRIASRDLTEEFDKARLNERENDVLKAFQTIDDSIIGVESFSIGEPNIYIKREGESRLPLSLFGDAINRIADLILRLINNQNCILLIDEIENGIHHSNQVAFWNIIYKLSSELNVQIFATTHSLEMIKAFIKAGSDYPNLSTHFELTKHKRTGKIVAIKRDLDTLDYGISHNKQVRGE
ncbi:AAA family ATPase [Cronbergia sp. UHCC 0137]|uniref:AAA family ATPase n=1 Tax=Cronbergia sp. UHCC 0137 TaxID=3110239 RepID=UPI002B1FF99E|nr:AAA family ATPase [Cronbergia sp. UHCC 0137]MEA5619675.1 AAA family ATPase [Cronbergia sp. UHCC 0137]